MNYQTVIITLAVLLAIVAAGWLIDHLRHKGIDVGKVAQAADKVLSVADTVTDAAAAIVPGPVTGVLQRIVDAAKIGVSSAEQLYINGSLPADQRKATATGVLRRALELDGIAYEGDVAQLGDAAMEAAVRALPRTSTQAVKVASQPGSGAAASDTTGAK